MALPAQAAGTFRLGGELEVARLGYGAMRLSGQPGNFGPYRDPEAAHRLLRRAVELGVNFIDTAISYGWHWNERHIAEALHPYAGDLVIATKAGALKLGAGELHLDGRPSWLKKSCEFSLRDLRVERIDLFQYHVVDPQVPLEDSVGALADLRREGKIRLVGLSNVTVGQIETARRIVPVASVQNRFNVALAGQSPVLDYCAREGIAFLPYGPLGARAFETASPFETADSPIRRVAARHGATPSQVALAWLLQRAPNMIPIPGTTALRHLEDNVGAAALRLDAADLADLANVNLPQHPGPA
jgi:pyridoxine 4-dehydrogenase